MLRRYVYVVGWALNLLFSISILFLFQPHFDILQWRIEDFNLVGASIFPQFFASFFLIVITL